MSFIHWNQKECGTLPSSHSLHKSIILPMSLESVHHSQPHSSCSLSKIELYFIIIFNTKVGKKKQQKKTKAGDQLVKKVCSYSTHPDPSEKLQWVVAAGGGRPVCGARRLLWTLALLPPVGPWRGFKRIHAHKDLSLRLRRLYIVRVSERLCSMLRQTLLSRLSLSLWVCECVYTSCTFYMLILGKKKKRNVGFWLSDAHSETASALDWFIIYLFFFIFYLEVKSFLLSE